MAKNAGAACFGDGGDVLLYKHKLRRTVKKDGEEVRVPTREACRGLAGSGAMHFRPAWQAIVFETQERRMEGLFQPTLLKALLVSDQVGRCRSYHGQLKPCLVQYLLPSGLARAAEPAVFKVAWKRFCHLHLDFPNYVGLRAAARRVEGMRGHIGAEVRPLMAGGAGLVASSRVDRSADGRRWLLHAW